METMSNVQSAGDELVSGLGSKMFGEATDIVNEGVRTLVRLGRQQPLVVLGLAAAAAIAYAALKPATRKSVRATAMNLASSLRQVGVAAPAAKRRTGRGSGARAKRVGRGQRSGAGNGRQAHA